MKSVSQSASLRAQARENLSLLANARLQTDYPPSEIISMYCDDFFAPKSRDFVAAFSADELKDLAQLYGLVCRAERAREKVNAQTVNDVLKLGEWREMMAFAKECEARMIEGA